MPTPQVKFHQTVVRFGGIAAALNEVAESGRNLFQIYQERCGDTGPDIYQYIIISTEDLSTPAESEVPPAGLSDVPPGARAAASFDVDELEN